LRRTKIVCTIGPATRDPEMLDRLVRGGLDLARLNFSHGSHAEHGEVIAALRSVAERRGRPVGILQDLAGPKVRIGTLRQGPVTLQAGRRFRLCAADVPGDEEAVSLGYRELPGEVEAGDQLLLSDGALELKVLETSPGEILCEVVVGGPLSSHKGINLPSRSLRMPILSEKDHRDLLFGLEQGVDFVAVSFVRSAEDVVQVRRVIREQGRSVPLIAKIEKHEALQRIDEILEQVDGIMIARGDLGVEIPLERIPGVQKELSRRANRAGLPVITATQMLKSMVDSPRPTRAETTDVANAVLDGSDALMLSEETAVGRYPEEALGMLIRVAEAAEEGFPHREWISRYDRRERLQVDEAVALAACQMAERVDAAAVITCTKSGSTTRLVAKYRPRRPVLAVTPEEATCRRLALVWGAVPIRSPLADREDRMVDEAMRLAVSRGLLEPGRKAVITAGMPLRVAGTTNLIRVVEAGPEHVA